MIPEKAQKNIEEAMVKENVEFLSEQETSGILISMMKPILKYKIFLFLLDIMVPLTLDYKSLRMALDTVGPSGQRREDIGRGKLRKSHRTVIVSYLISKLTEACSTTLRMAKADFPTFYMTMQVQWPRMVQKAVYELNVILSKPKGVVDSIAKAVSVFETTQGKSFLDTLPDDVLENLSNAYSKSVLNKTKTEKESG